MSCSHFLQSCCLVHTLGYVACTILSACSGGEKSGCVRLTNIISIAGRRLEGKIGTGYARLTPDYGEIASYSVKQAY